MRHFKYTWVVAALLLTACGQGQQKPQEEEGPAAALQQTWAGDSTYYGLACDGCTDSVLVVMPTSCADPDTFDIINARQAHRIMGRPHIGDELAVIRNPADSAEALAVINLRTLCGDWCYEAMPTFRNLDQLPQRVQRRMMERMPDSVRQRLLVPREYMLRLKYGYTAQTRGVRRAETTTDEMSPVEYPDMKHYTEWHLYNGRLVLMATTPDGKSAQSDTADIVVLHSDTLVLRMGDHGQGYYRKN